MNDQLVTDFFKSASKRRKIESKDVKQSTGEYSSTLIFRNLRNSPLYKSPSTKSLQSSSPLYKSPSTKSLQSSSPLYRSSSTKSLQSSSPLYRSPLVESPKFQSPPKSSNTSPKHINLKSGNVRPIARDHQNSNDVANRLEYQRSRNQQSNQLSESSANRKNRFRDVKSMREVFTQAQYIQQSQPCVQVLHNFIIEFEFHEFYEEFCRNVRCSLKFENANPKVKNILDTISSFLISAKKKYSLENLKRTSDFDANFRSKRSKANTDSSISDESMENDENVPTDEIIQMINESTSESTRSKNKLIKPASSDQLQKLYRIFRNLLDFTINDLLIPFLNSININTRLNTSYLLGKLIYSIDDLDVSLFDRLKSKLLERLIDKSPKMRSTSAHLLYRFQDRQLQLTQNDAVQDALCFHLKYDSSPAVRLSCLNVILINRDTLPVILSKTRDVNKQIRERAFIKLAKKINFKQQLISEQRLLLVRNGLHDRSQSVVDAFKNQVISAWVRSYDENLIELLKDLQLSESVRSSFENSSYSSKDSNFKLIELFIESYFESFSTEQKKLSKFHSIMINFCKTCLNNEFLIKNEHFTNETFFLWSSLTRFLKRQEDKFDDECANNEIRLRLKRQFSMVLESSCSIKKPINQVKDQKDDQLNNQINDQNINQTNDEFDENNNATSYSTGHQLTNENNEGDRPVKRSIDENRTVNIPPISKQPIDHSKENQTIDNANIDHEDYSILDLVLPEFSKFVNFFQTFCESSSNVGENVEFMFKQLILFLENYEIEDNSRRTMIFELVEYLLQLDKNVIEMATFIECLMSYVQRNMFKRGRDFFNYSIELLQRLDQKLEQEEFDRLNERITAKEIRELELQNANRTIQMHELKDKLDEALSHCQYHEAHEYQTQIDRVKHECNKLIKEIKRMRSVLEYQEASKQSESGEQFRIQNYPIEHIKHLQLFEYALKSTNRLITLAESKIDQYILPGILSIDSQVRYHALRALNEACFLSIKVANKFCKLYYEICLKDNIEIRNLALEGLIDSLVEHGGTMLYGDEGDLIQNTETSSLAASSKNTMKSNESYQDSECAEEFESNEMAPKLEASETIGRPIRRSKEKIETMIKRTERIVDKSHFIEINSTTHSTEEIRKRTTKEFIKFLLIFAKQEDMQLSHTSVMGICKLMLLGRIYSPKLLSELILIYFDSGTNRTIAQSIGTFLPIYCAELSNHEIQLPNHLTGQHCLIECFMYTVESVYHLERGQLIASSFSVAHSNYYDSDIDVQNVISFMLNLLDSKHHFKVTFEFCEKVLEILQIEREDEYQFEEPFISNYLIRSLNSFILVDLNDKEQDTLNTLLQSIKDEVRFEELKRASSSRIEKFAAKVTKLISCRSNH